jgi:hypothetical protein
MSEEVKGEDPIIPKIEVVGATKEMLRKLHIPIENLKWREARNAGNKIVFLAYIDSRDCQHMLDKCVGPENWKERYYKLDDVLFCELSIRCALSDGTYEWVGKSDCGSESNVEKDKGNASDAFKRAGVKWGINRKAYSLKEAWADKGSKKGTVKLGGKDVYIKDAVFQNHCNKNKRYV